MMQRSVIAIVAVLAVATGVVLTTAAMADDAQKQQQSWQDQQSMQAQPAGAQMGAGDMGEATSPDPERAFLAVLVSHARLQRQISELVAQKATNPQIKDLAQRIAADQQQISQRIQQAAQQEGITLQPDRMLPRDQAVLQFLQQLQPAVLERHYVFHEAGVTQTNQLIAQWLANNAQRPQIKQAAAEIAGKLQERNQTVMQLAQAEVRGTGAQPAGGQMTPGAGGEQTPPGGEQQ